MEPSQAVYADDLASDAGGSDSDAELREVYEEVARKLKKRDLKQDEKTKIKKKLVYYQQEEEEQNQFNEVLERHHTNGSIRETSLRFS